MGRVVSSAVQLSTAPSPSLTSVSHIQQKTGRIVRKFDTVSETTLRPQCSALPSQEHFLLTPLLRALKIIAHIDVDPSRSPHRCPDEQQHKRTDESAIKPRYLVIVVEIFDTFESTNCLKHKRVLLLLYIL